MKVIVLICRKCKRMIDFRKTGAKRKNGTIYETYLAPVRCPICKRVVSEKNCQIVMAGEA